MINLFKKEAVKETFRNDKYIIRKKFLNSEINFDKHFTLAIELKGETQYYGFFRGDFFLIKGDKEYKFINKYKFVEAVKEAFRYYSNDNIWDYEIDGADYKHCTYISLWAFER